jgi:hypothetical protein
MLHAAINQALVFEGHSLTDAVEQARSFLHSRVSQDVCIRLMRLFVSDGEWQRRKNLPPPKPPLTAGS